MNDKSNSGQNWTRAEEDLLKAAFEEGVDVHALASAHERSLGAVVTRLVRLGLLAAGVNGYYKPGPIIVTFAQIRSDRDLG